MSGLRIEPAPLDGPEAQTLIEALNAELRARYPEEGATHFRLDPEEVAPGRGAFLIAYLVGAPAGCGAVRLIGDDEAEVKRMYVTPACRGRGIAGEVLARLEREARALGAKRLVLETGVRQPEAQAVYKRTGFEVIPCFGEYAGSPFSLCMAKVLD